MREVKELQTTQLSVECVPEHQLPLLFFLLSQMDMGNSMLGAIRKTMPPHLSWSLTLTGDVAASTGGICSSDGDTRVQQHETGKACLFTHPDGSLDIMVSLASILDVPDDFEPDRPFERWIAWATRLAGDAAARALAITSRPNQGPQSEGHHA